MRWIRRPLREGETDHERNWGLFLGISISAMMLWALFLPIPHWGCMWKRMTTIPCPGCGSTRSVLALSRGEIFEAFRLQPGLFVALCVALFYVPYALWVYFLDRPRWRPVLSARESWWIKRVSITLLIALWTYLIVDGR